MLAKIKDFFQNELGGEETEKSGHMTEKRRRLASAALLIEVAVVDDEFDKKEMATLKAILQEQFDISAEDCEKLTLLAHNETEESTSLYQFTQLINQYCSMEEKFELVKGMWAIAYADGDLDKYEEYVIRKVSDLIHVAHGDFIRAKHIVRTEKFSD